MLHAVPSLMLHLSMPGLDDSILLLLYLWPCNPLWSLCTAWTWDYFTFTSRAHALSLNYVQSRVKRFRYFFLKIVF